MQSAGVGREGPSSVRRHRRSGKGSRQGAWWLAATLLLQSCTADHSRSDPSTTTTPDAAVTTTTVTTTTGNTGTGGRVTLQNVTALRLSQGHAVAAPATPVPVVSGTPLDGAGVHAVVDRLPAWTVGDALTSAFRWPTETRPAPRAGATVDVAFPADTQPPPPEVTSGPLHVVRFQPEGEVPLAPFATITFDQPMVAITTLGQLDGADVPATITPAVAGHWQWIGTRTLRFDATSAHVDRLPMATQYTVSVPAGTTSAIGGVLADAVTFQFSTPPPTVQSFVPTGPSQPLTPVLVASFDQRVDPAAVLATTEVQADGKRVEVRLATDAEIAADETASQATSQAQEGRWVAFRPVVPFAPDTSIDIAIGPGTPSAEGPTVTTEAAGFSAHTYTPLTVRSISCNYGGAVCLPQSDIVVEFDNVLDPHLFDPTSVHIDPPLAGASVGVNGNILTIHGASEGRTKYTVTIPADLTDIYGQHLGSEEHRTVEIGPAAPMLRPFEQPLTTVDPSAPHPSVSIVTVNHHDARVRLFRVAPKDWNAYVQYFVNSMQRGPLNGAVPDPPWPAFSDQIVAIDDSADRAVETTIDLTNALADTDASGRLGHVVVLVETTDNYPVDGPDYWSNRPSVTWAQSTGIGLDATFDNNTLQTWTTRLSDGHPLAGVSVQEFTGDGSAAAPAAATDTDGLATISRSARIGQYLVATAGADTAILANSFYGGGWQRQAASDEARWFVFDDRHTYRPGETVSLKGWVRRLTVSGDDQLQLMGPDAKVSFIVTDGQGNAIGNGTADVGPLGGFNLTFPIPADANLGFASVQLQLAGVAGLGYGADTHSFQIQEFRRPQFEVQARTESPDPAVVGTPTTLAVDANYYAGGPLGAAPVDWQVSTTAATYSPPGWEDYSFGRWTPWWYSTVDSGFGRNDVGGVVDGPCCGPPGAAPATTSFHGETDASGTHYLQVDVAGLDPALAGLPIAVSAQATVTDVDRQQLAGTTSLIVHPSELYVGLRGAQTFVNRGDPLRIDAIVTGIDGKVVAGRPVHVVASRSDSVFRNGTWTTTDVDPQTCDVTSGTDAVSCTFATTVGGTYTVRATVTDDQQRTSLSELTRWVSGAVTPPTRTVAQEALTIVPDAELYRPGATAHLLVQSPFATGTGLLTLTRNGIIGTQRFDVVDGTAVVDVPVSDAEIPGVDVQIEVVGATERLTDAGAPAPDAPRRPAFAVGSIHLPISTASRTLTVTAEPHDAAVLPGASTQVDVSVTNGTGAAVAGSELAVVVVDEAVLALSGGQGTGDPLAAFYGALPTYLSTQYGRASIVLSSTDTFGQNGSGGGATADTTAGSTAAAPATTAAASDAAGSKSAESIPASPAFAAGGTAAGTTAVTTPIAVRTNFDALAVFEPSVLTDSAGHATIDVPLPDNLTRYRVMVVAVAGAQQFGSTEANITARLPLMVRPSAPRFLNFGDSFELPVVVQNQTNADMSVDVVVQADNLTVGGGADAATGVGQRVIVPANDRVEVRFPMAAVSAGTARFRVAATSGDASDAATVELPVYTPATAEAFATYGVIDDGATMQPVQAPTGVIPEFGGLDITTSSTSLQALTDAVIYLADYPYRSADALASRIVSIATLRPVLSAFDAPGLPPADKLDAAVTDDVAALVALQNDDGGFPFWLHGDTTDPFISVQAAQALVVAAGAGYQVPPESLTRALSFLAQIEQSYPATYSQDTRDTISAAALHVRALGGDRDTAKANALYADRADALSLDALAWLWPVVSDQAAIARIERTIQNAAVDTAGAVTFTTKANDEAYLTLHSDRRTDGIILDALIQMRPQSDLVPKVVAGLLAGQTQGRWDNVQENAAILLALKRYFDAFEAQTPDFVAKVWLRGRFAGDHEFQGRSTDRARLSIPTADLIGAGNADLTISRDPGADGTVAGRLYYRIGLRTAPSNLQLSPLDRGFTVTREYSALDDPSDVTRDGDGTWHIRAGAHVRVRLTMVADSQRMHVALIDPLPAGLEVLNPALATTPKVPTDGGGVIPAAAGPESWWYGTWFDHQNLRDDRAEAFATYLPAGVYDYTYVATATTPGTFVVPPTRAEEMYSPETFGRASTERVVIG